MIYIFKWFLYSIFFNISKEKETYYNIMSDIINNNKEIVYIYVYKKVPTKPASEKKIKYIMDYQKNNIEKTRECSKRYY